MGAAGRITALSKPRKMCALWGKSGVSVPRVFQEPWESPQMKSRGPAAREKELPAGTGPRLPQELLSTILPSGFLSALGAPMAASRLCLPSGCL